MTRNLLLLLFSLLLIEALLQGVALVSPAVKGLLFPHIPGQIADARLEKRGNPAHPENDAAGYRNRDRLEQYDTVVLGDSHVYGAGVRPVEAWPARLAAQTGRTVYNMGIGGYGAAHHLLQLDEALALHPREVLLAVYFGNDFADTARLASTSREVQALLQGDELAQIRQAEQAAPIAQVTQGLFVTKGAPAEGGRLRTWVADHLALYGLARAIRQVVAATPGDPMLSRDFATASAALGTDDLARAQPFEGEGWRTVLTPAYRLVALDETDARIRIGFALTLRIIERIKHRLDAQGIALRVVLLPTKEMAFATRVTPDPAFAQYHRLVAAEGHLRTRLIEALGPMGVAYVGPLPRLQASPEQPYFETPTATPMPRGIG